MKRLIACAVFLLAATSGYTQGFVQLHNYSNTNRSVFATSQGLFWEDPYYPWPVTTPAPINRDFNVAFYCGSDSNSLSLIAIFAGPGAVGDNAAGPGTFFDPLSGVYPVPGTTAASTTAFFRIVMWKGNVDPYNAIYKVESSVFVNPVGPMTNAPGLEGMPAVCLCWIGDLVQTPVITQVYVSGANLFINGTGGAPYRGYDLLSSTNIESSAAAWSLVATGAFTGTRSFSITNPINPAIPQSFFRLQVP